MTPTERDDLRRLAGSATGGPWQRSGVQQKLGGEVGLTVGTDSHWFFWSPIGVTHNSQAQCIRDLDFIAAANPQTVLALLDEIDALRKGLEPFARMSFEGSIWQDQHEAAAVLYNANTDASVRLGDFNRARALTTSSKESGE